MVFCLFYNGRFIWAYGQGKEIRMETLTFDRVRAHTAKGINERLDHEALQRVERYGAADKATLTRRIAELDREWDTERVGSQCLHSGVYRCDLRRLHTPLLVVSSRRRFTFSLDACGTRLVPTAPDHPPPRRAHAFGNRCREVRSKSIARRFFGCDERIRSRCRAAGRT